MYCADDRLYKLKNLHECKLIHRIFFQEISEEISTLLNTGTDDYFYDKVSSCQLRFIANLLDAFRRRVKLGLQAIYEVPIRIRTSVFFICPIAIAYSMGQLIKVIFTTVCIIIYMFL